MGRRAERCRVRRRFRPQGWETRCGRLRRGCSSALTPTLSLAGEGEEGGRLVARFDLSGVSSLREDAGARARRHLQLVQAGILTINEVRAKEGLEPVPWGDGPNAAE